MPKDANDHGGTGDGIRGDRYRLLGVIEGLDLHDARGRVDHVMLDGTTERDLALQQQEDDTEAKRDMAQYARRVRRRLGLTQVELARRIDVPHETIRNWEQGKRCPSFRESDDGTHRPRM